MANRVLNKIIDDVNGDNYIVTDASAVHTSDVVSTYSSTGTAPVNGTAVSAALGTLDAEKTSTDGTNVQVKVTEVDGKITGVSISTDNTAASSHAHGNITNGGALQTTDVAIASGDKLVITDYSSSNKVARSSTAFDGSTTTTALTPKGTFESFAKSGDITSAINNLDSNKTSTDGTNVQVKVTQTDGKISAVNITTDTTASATHTHGNISNTGTLTDNAAAAAGNDYVVIRDADNDAIQTSTIKGTDVASAISSKHTHSSLTLSKTAQAYDGTHTLALPSSDPYTTARTPSSHTHGNIANDGTLTDTAAAAAGNDYVVIRDDTNDTIQTSTIKGTDVADAVSNKHSHSTLTLSTTAQAYDGSHTLKLPESDPYTSARIPASHTHGNISDTGTLTDTAAAAAGNDYVVIRDADNATIQTSTIKGTDVADAVSKKHSHSTLTLSTTAQAYDGTHTLALPANDPYTSDRTPSSHTHGNITNDGKIGSTANLPVITGTSGTVTTGSFATTATAVATSSAAGSANTFSRGDHKHSISLATGDAAGQVKIAGSNVNVNGWSGKADVATTLGGYGITDAYTKSETDALLNGQVQVVATLPATGTTGVVYYVGPSGSGADQYEEYIWDATNTQFIKVGERSIDLSNYLLKTGDGKDVTVTFTEASSRATITSGSKLSTLFGQIKNWYSSFGSLAWKSSVTDSDLSGTISDTHIASASTWNAKQDALATQTAYTSKGTATKVPQITTNSLGQVTGITEVTISGVTPASHTHGNITDGGLLQTNDVTITSGDKLVITDSSDSNKVARASVSFDGSTTTKALTPKGTFETFSKLTIGTTSSTAAAGNHAHGNIGNGGTLTDTAAAAAGSDYLVIRDEDDNKIQTSTIKGTDVATAISNTHTHSTITLSTTAQAYDGTNTIALPTSDPYNSARTPLSHNHGNIANGGTLTDTAAEAAGNDYVVIRDAENNKIQTSNIKCTDVASAVSSKHTHSSLTLSTTAQAYDGTHTLALPSSDPYTSSRTPSSHTHGNISNTGTLTDTAAAAAGNDYVVIRDADTANIQTSTIKGTDVADAVSKKHSHSTLTLSTTAQAYDGTNTLKLPATDPYTSARTPESHNHGNIANGGTLTDTAAAAATDDLVVIRDASDNKIQTSTIKGTDVADAVSKKHSHSTLTLSTTAQAYDGTHTLALPSTDPYTSARTPASHTHGNITNTGTLNDTAAAAAGNDYVVIRDADNAKIQTSTIKGVDVADAVSKKHSHSTLTLSTTAQAYDGTHTLALPSTDPYTSARTPSSHTHGNIQNGGTLQTTDITIATGDKLVVTDSSDSSKVARASIAFDGSTTDQFLSKKGTWSDTVFKSSNLTVTKVSDANAAIPSLTTTDDTGTCGDFFIGTSASNTPNASYNFHIHTILFKISAGYRVTQFAMASGSSPSSVIYERAGASSDGSTWTSWSAWTTFNNYSLPLAASGTRGGIQIGYSESGTNYAVKLSSEKAYVSVPWTDTKQNVTLATTTKAFITGVSTTPTSTAQALTGLADTGVYLTTTAGEINATQFKVNEHCTMQYNSTKSSLDFVFS